MQTQTNTTLDPKVKNLAMAIRQAESGGDYNASGASTENGAYQFMPETWKAWSGKYLGDSNAEMSRENQNKVAYSRIKEWKDAGFQPAQIASMWNAGEGRPNAYKENWRGTNSMGVKYDTPAYVEKVKKYHNEIKAGQPQIAPVSRPAAGGMGAPQVTTSASLTARNAEQSAEQPAEQPAPEQSGSRLESFTNALGFGKTVDTLGSMIARGRATDEEKDFIQDPTGKEKAGALLNVGSLALGAGTAGLAGAKLFGGKLMGALGTGVTGGAVAGKDSKACSGALGSGAANS